MNAQATLNKAIYRQPEVLFLLGVSKTTLWRMVNDGKFPPPLKIGQRANGWKVTTVQEWLNKLGV
jgi:prophage regulatory protein